MLKFDPNGYDWPMPKPPPYPADDEDKIRTTVHKHGIHGYTAELLIKNLTKVSRDSNSD